MAQILKFKEGGPATPKWGTFTIDNVTYEMTDDNIASLYNHAKQLDRDVQYQFGFIIDALKSGQNLTYANNVLSGNIDWDVSEGQNKKIQKRVGRGLGKGRDARLAISSIDDLKLTNPEQPVKTLKFQDRYVEYEKGDDGKFILNNDKRNYIHSAGNQEIIDFLLAIKDYSLSDEPFQIEGLDKDESWIRNWYTAYSNDFVDILGRIQTGDSTDADKEILNDFLIYLDGPTSSKPQDHKDSAERDGTPGAEYSGGLNFGVRPSGVVGDQNTTTLTINDPNFINLLNGYGKPIWLNDDFVKIYPEVKSLLDGFDNGIFYIDGTFYDANDPKLLQNKTFQQFVNDNKRNPGSNNIIVQTFSNQQEGWRNLNSFGNKQYYSPYGSGVIKDLTGQYVLRPMMVDGIGEIIPRYLFQIYPTTVRDDMYDQFGRIKPEFLSYSIIDNSGKWTILDNYNWNRYISELNSSTDAQRRTYYGDVPDYLYRYATNGHDKLIDLGNGVFWLESKNRYIVVERQTNGTQRALLLRPGYSPKKGIHPLQITNGIYDQVEMREGKYVEIDLSSFGVSLKHGGTIPKADGGLKFGTPFSLGGSYTQEPDVEYVLTPEGGVDFLQFFENGKKKKYVPQWYLTMMNLEPSYTPLTDVGASFTTSFATPLTTPADDIEAPAEDIQSVVEDDNSKDNYGATKSEGPSVVPSEIAGLTRLIVNLQSSAKSRQITKKFADSARRNILAMQAPQKTMPKYVEPTENRIIDEQISDTLNKPYAYSDPVLRERMRDKDLATVNYLKTQKNANSSQAFNQHRSISQQINDENSAARVNLNNTVLQSLNGIDQMEMNSELASNNTATTSWTNYLLELQDKFSKFEDQYKEALVANENLDIIRKYESDLEEAFEASGGASKLSAESQALYTQYGFRPAMLREVDPRAYEDLTRKFNLETAIARVNHGRSGILSIYPEFKRTPSAKNGAKLSKLTTQMIINQGKKNVDINKLNNEIMKIFLKLIK